MKCFIPYLRAGSITAVTEAHGYCSLADPPNWRPKHNQSIHHSPRLYRAVLCSVCGGKVRISSKGNFQRRISHFATLWLHKEGKNQCRERQFISAEDVKAAEEEERARGQRSGGTERGSEGGRTTCCFICVVWVRGSLRFIASHTTLPRVHACISTEDQLEFRTEQSSSFSVNWGHRLWITLGICNRYTDDLCYCGDAGIGLNHKGELQKPKLISGV